MESLGYGDPVLSVPWVPLLLPQCSHTCVPYNVEFYRNPYKPYERVHSCHSTLRFAPFFNRLTEEAREVLYSNCNEVLSEARRGFLGICAGREKGSNLETKCHVTLG